MSGTVRKSPFLLRDEATHTENDGCATVRHHHEPTIRSIEAIIQQGAAEAHAEQVARQHKEQPLER